MVGKVVYGYRFTYLMVFFPLLEDSIRLEMIVIPRKTFRLFFGRTVMKRAEPLAFDSILAIMDW